MAVDRGLLLLVVSAAVLVGLASASPFISDSVFLGSVGSTGRSLLQAKKNCPVNFEFQNYTIITSKCKGPRFPAKQCCDAFKEFACPFNEYINDESNDCASTMFSYINLYGKYPPGLFANECREGKLGLSCDGVSQKDSVVSSAGQQAQSSLLAFIMLTFGLAALWFH
uniref:GPI-anchored protein LLG1-like domain-containing protein n=1 Tax=Oryza glumipatula TaxID=40148 RepID=A0A0D9YXJ4_9ORYZ